MGRIVFYYYQQCNDAFSLINGQKQISFQIINVLERNYHLCLHSPDIIYHSVIHRLCRRYILRQGSRIFLLLYVIIFNYVQPGILCLHALFIEST